MSDIVKLAADSGVTLRLARLKPPVGAVLERDGVLDRIGPTHIHGSVHEAISAQLEESPLPGDPSAS